MLALRAKQEFVVGTEAGGAIGRLSEALGKLPGIGPKTAERLTHYLLAASRTEVFALADALRAIKENIRRCSQCCNLTEGELCSLCADPRRDASVICVVELAKDLTVMERVGTYRGQYHVLGGRLAPLDNIGPDQLTIDALVRRVPRAGHAHRRSSGPQIRRPGRHCSFILHDMASACHARFDPSRSGAR